MALKPGAGVRSSDTNCNTAQCGHTFGLQLPADKSIRDQQRKQRNSLGGQKSNRRLH